MRAMGLFPVRHPHASSSPDPTSNLSTGITYAVLLPLTADVLIIHLVPRTTARPKDLQPLDEQILLVFSSS